MVYRLVNLLGRCLTCSQSASALKPKAPLHVQASYSFSSSSRKKPTKKGDPDEHNDDDDDGSKLSTIFTMEKEAFDSSEHSTDVPRVDTKSLSSSHGELNASSPQLGYKMPKCPLPSEQTPTNDVQALLTNNQGSTPTPLQLISTPLAGEVAATPSQAQIGDHGASEIGKTTHTAGERGHASSPLAGGAGHLSPSGKASKSRHHGSQKHLSNIQGHTSKMSRFPFKSDSALITEAATPSSADEDGKPPRLVTSIPTTFSTLSNLLDANRNWAKSVIKKDPEYFKALAEQQTPQLLWIGCSDSRVPANQILNLKPGEVFVHRNIANVVNHTDLNCLSVLQYAVDVLKVKHIMVVGHYGCGGVLASLTTRQYGLIDNWLRAIKDIYVSHAAKLDALPDNKSRADLMCELNVAQSVRNVCATTIVQNAWQRNQSLSVHGWCYRVEDGVLRDLHICISAPSQVSHVFKMVEEKKSAEA